MDAEKVAEQWQAAVQDGQAFCDSLMRFIPIAPREMIGDLIVFARATVEGLHGLNAVAIDWAERQQLGELLDGIEL